MESNLNREQIYEQLNELIPELKRRDATRRVMSESGADFLLDQLVELQKAESRKLEIDYERTTT